MTPKASLPHVLELPPEGGHASAEKIYDKAVSIIRQLGLEGEFLIMVPVSES
jgi:hypothetical protein